MLHPIEKRWPFADPSKLQLFSLATPNGVKVSTALEELELPYEAHRIDITEGDQFTDEYKTLSPNSKIPAMVDPAGPSGEPLALMESGAILIHLADKTGRLLPHEPRQRSACLQWLFFQVGHIGPMFGQFGHFYKYATDKCDHPYPLQRYTLEAQRLLGVLEARLADREWIIDTYSIADIATFPWVLCLDQFYEAGDHLKLNEFKAVADWLERCRARPGSQRGAKVCA